jgi:hypothetical protein
MPRHFNVASLPEFLPDYLQATMRRIDAADLKKRIGMKRTKAARILLGIVQKLEKNDSGTYRLRESDVDRDERALIEYLCTTFIARPAFDGARLYEDFSATLRSHGLLRKEELTSFVNVSIPVALFAVTVMHNCAIKVDDSLTVLLRARAELGVGQVVVNCAIPPHHTGAYKGISYASSIFKVESADLSAYLDPVLPSSSDWEFDLEISADGRLVPIR